MTQFNVMINIFNANISACHQTGTCHWEHVALLLIGQQEYHDFVQELGIGLDFGLAKLMDTIQMFNKNIATSHQTGTCHWDHPE